MEWNQNELLKKFLELIQYIIIFMNSLELKKLRNFFSIYVIFVIVFRMEVKVYFIGQFEERIFLDEIKYFWGRSDMNYNFVEIDKFKLKEFILLFQSWIDIIVFTDDRII